MLSTAQILAVKPPAPSVPFVQFPCHWDHYSGQHHSDPHNSTFHGILLPTLCAVSPSPIIHFQKFIRSMPHQFYPTGTLAFDFSGDSAKSEVDVATYLQSQVLNPTWQAVLAMLPSEKDYELMATKPFEIDGVPDQVLVRNFVNEDGSTYSEEFAIVVFKGPGFVRRLLPVIKMWDQCGYHEWVNLTQKLRKYAQNSTAKDIIVMDEAAAIYFRFADPTDDVNYSVEFLFVDSTCEKTTGNSPLLMRELVAFVCWTALVKKGVTFPTFANDRNREAILSCYRSILRPLINNPQSGRPVLAREQTEPKFTGWTVGLLFEMGLVPPFDHHADAELSGPPDLDVQIPSTSPDSSCDDLSSSSHHDHHRKARDFNTPPSGRATYIVESVFTNHVAELSCQQLPGRWIAKFFSADTESMELLAREISIYNLCKQRQGHEIPYAYGTAVINSVPGRVLLLEKISPGTTISSIQDTRVADEETASRLQILMGSAKAAVESLHRCGATHNHLNGGNLLVCKGEGEGDAEVVIIDFGVAMEFGDGSGRKQWEDWAMLRAAFELKR